MNKEEQIVPKLRFPEFENDGEWIVREFRKVGEFIGGGTPSTTKPEYWEGNIQWYTPTEVKNGILKPSIRTITKLGLKKSSAKLLPKGTILITTRATIGDVAITLEECTTNQGFQSLIVNKSEVNSFWYYWIIKNKSELIKRATGSTFKEIGKTDIKVIQTLSPEKKEQQKIANCLSSLDEVINAETEKLELLQDHKKGLLQQLFPQKGETQPKYRFPEFRNDEDWKDKMISELANRFDNLRKPVTASDRKEGTTPYYGANGIQSYIKGYTHNGEYILVAEDGANDLQNYPVQYVNGKVWVNNHAHVLQGKKAICNNLFLMYAIQNLNVEPYLVGGGRAKLNANIMMKINFLVPKLLEQQKIANCLSSVDNLIQAQDQKIEDLQNHKKGLLQQLFPNVNEL